MKTKLDWVRAYMYFTKHSTDELEEMNKDPEWEYKDYYMKYKYNSHKD